jgi:DNA-binding YbaB/EbfC family protein
MQRDLELAREELKSARVTGTAGGGVVSLDADGDGQILAVRIQPAIAEGDKSLLEDLVLAAARDAFAKAAVLRQERLARVSGGLNLPGLT